MEATIGFDAGRGAEPAVALLRGVNVGARNAVPQRALAERLEQELGAPVRHLLQSGNIAVARAQLRSLASQVAGIIHMQTGLEIPVIVRTVTDLAVLVEANPWPDTDPTRVHLSLWDDPHNPELAAAMLTQDWGGDEIVFVPGGAWMRYATASHQAKLGNHVIERKLRVVATARNARTMTRLLELAQSLA